MLRGVRRITPRSLWEPGSVRHSPEPREGVLFFLLEDLAETLLEPIQIPVPLIPDNGAQYRVDVLDRLQNIAQHIIDLTRSGHFLGHLDQIAENGPFRP